MNEEYEYNAGFDQLPRDIVHKLLDDILHAEGASGLLRKRELTKIWRARINEYVAYRTSPAYFLKSILYPQTLSEICDIYQHDKTLYEQWTPIVTELQKAGSLESLSNDSVLLPIMYVLFSNKINDIPLDLLVLATRAFGEIERRIFENLIPEAELKNYTELMTYSWRSSLLKIPEDLKDKSRVLDTIKLNAARCLLPKDLSAYEGAYRQYNLSGKNLTGFNLEGLYLHHIQLQGATLTNVRIRNSLLVNLPVVPTKNDDLDDIKEEKEEWRAEVELTCRTAASNLDGVILWESKRFPIKIQMSSAVILAWLNSCPGKDFAKRAHGVIANGIFFDDKEMMFLVSVYATLSDFMKKVKIPEDKFEACEFFKEFVGYFYKLLSSVKDKDYAGKIKNLLRNFCNKFFKDRLFNHADANEFVLELNFWNNLFYGDYGGGLSSTFMKDLLIRAEEVLARPIDDEAFGGLMFGLQNLEKNACDAYRYRKGFNAQTRNVFWEITQSAALLRFETNAQRILASSQSLEQKVNRIFELYNSMGRSALVMKQPNFVGAGFFSRLFDKSTHYGTVLNIIKNKLLEFLGPIAQQLKSDSIKKLDEIFGKTEEWQAEYRDLKLSLEWEFIPVDSKPAEFR